MSLLFSPIKIRDLEIKNRIMMSPMCQYSAVDGLAKDWHFIHYGSRAVGNVGLIMLEATAVLPNGRITNADLGLWTEQHAEILKHITSFINNQGSVAGIQLAHAGRKASTRVPKEGGGPLTIEKGGWTTFAPSALPFDDDYPEPKELSICNISSFQECFANAALKALHSGFKVIEIHAAHGYLIHEFLSPLTNKRTDKYGGSFENRIRFLTETVNIVREVWPEDYPLFVRISATDYAEGGWDLEQSIRLAKRLKEIGVDVIDVSSGGLLPDVNINADYGYQLNFANQIHKQALIKTATVGMNVNAIQAETILKNNMSDLIVFGRELLRNPYFALNAAKELETDIKWPIQYIRAKR